MEEKRFQRTTEDFVCEHCGAEVVGNGYTDHCPICLWGKHVDINPGDRAANCGGLMEPVGVEERAGKYIISYKCLNCQHRFSVKSAGADSMEAIIEISKVN